MIKCPYPQYTNIGIRKRLRSICSSRSFPSTVKTQIFFMLNDDYPEKMEDIEFVRDLVNASIVNKRYRGDLRYFNDQRLLIKIFDEIPMFYKNYLI